MYKNNPYVQIVTSLCSGHGRNDLHGHIFFNNEGNLCGFESQFSIYLNFVSMCVGVDSCELAGIFCV